jgi:hypothetical protein
VHDGTIWQTRGWLKDIPDELGFADDGWRLLQRVSLAALDSIS